MHSWWHSAAHLQHHPLCVHNAVEGEAGRERLRIHHVALRASRVQTSVQSLRIFARSHIRVCRPGHVEHLRSQRPGTGNARVRVNRIRAGSLTGRLPMWWRVSSHMQLLESDRRQRVASVRTAGSGTFQGCPHPHVSPRPLLRAMSHDRHGRPSNPTLLYRVSLTHRQDASMAADICVC